MLSGLIGGLVGVLEHPFSCVAAPRGVVFSAKRCYEEISGNEKNSKQNNNSVNVWPAVLDWLPKEITISYE